MKKIGYSLCLIIILLNMFGCEKKNNNDNLDNEFLSTEIENFLIGHTFLDARYIAFTFNVPYYEGYLSDAFMNEDLTLDGFIGMLEFVSDLNDGGSKLYRYNSSNQIFGDDNFNVLVCDSIYGIKDIFVAKNVNSLNGRCSVKMDGFSSISMEIKDGTLTKSGATIIIIDNSSNKNTYGSEYRLDKFVNNVWDSVPVIVSNYGFTAIGYEVDESNKLELDINWEWLYGKLESGKYRIVKRVYLENEGIDYYISAEFVIK